MPEERVDDFKDFQSPHEASIDRLVKALDRAYHQPFRLMWSSFLQGFMSAIGATVGTIVVVIISSFIFNRLGGFDLLKPSINKLQDLIIPKELRQAATSPTLSPQLTSQLQQYIQTPTPTPSSTNSPSPY